MEEAEEHRRHAAEDGDLLALDRLADSRDLEARNERDHAPVAHRHVHDARLAEGVEEGQHRQADIVVPEAEQATRGGAVHIEVEVGELGALGLAGGARGVEDHGGVVGAGRNHVEAGIATHQLGEGTRALGDQVRARLVDDEDGDAVRRTLERLAGEVLPADQELRFRVAEVEVHLGRLEENVHRHHDSARLEDAEVGDDELGNVGKHDADPVAGVHTPLLERGGDLVGEGVDLAIGEPEWVEDDSLLVRGGKRGFGEDDGEIQAHG